MKKCYRSEAYNARNWFCTSYTCICICLFVLLWLQKDFMVLRQNRGLFSVILMTEKTKPPPHPPTPLPTPGRPCSNGLHSRGFLVSACWVTFQRVSFLSRIWTSPSEKLSKNYFLQYKTFETKRSLQGPNQKNQCSITN